MTLFILLPIGIGVMVAGVRLMLVHNSLRRAGNLSATQLTHVWQEGLTTLIGGLVLILVGISYSPVSSGGGNVFITAGSTFMYLGILSWIQLVVQSGRGNAQQVYIGAWVVTCIGFLLAIAYLVLSILGHL